MERLLKLLLTNLVMGVGYWGALIALVCTIATADPWYFWAMVAGIAVGTFGLIWAFWWDVTLD